MSFDLDGTGLGLAGGVLLVFAIPAVYSLVMSFEGFDGLTPALSVLLTLLLFSTASV